MDQSVVAGLGNIYVCEALFRAGLSPRRRASTVRGGRAERLATAIREAAARGAKLMLSMPHQPFVTEMYRGFQRHEVRTRRSVSARSAGRGTAGELLITNY